MTPRALLQTRAKATARESDDGPNDDTKTVSRKRRRTESDQDLGGDRCQGAIVVIPYTPKSSPSQSSRPRLPVHASPSKPSSISAAAPTTESPTSALSMSTAACSAGDAPPGKESPSKDPPSKDSHSSAPGLPALPLDAATWRSRTVRCLDAFAQLSINASADTLATLASDLIALGTNVSTSLAVGHRTALEQELVAARLAITQTQEVADNKRATAEIALREADVALAAAKKADDDAKKADGDAVQAQLQADQAKAAARELNARITAFTRLEDTLQHTTDRYRN